MFESLKITDYQSIANAKIPLGRSTIIVGPSGRGKSTVMRAFASICFNQVPKRFVRHGQRKAKVALTFDGGRVVAWEKSRDKGAVYALDDQEYTRVGRNVPPDIEQALRVRRIEVDKNVSWRPQFHLQFDQPLLLTESSTLAARALAQLTKLSVLVEAQVECRRDKIRAERARTAAEEDAARSKEQLAGLPNIRQTRNTMERITKQLRQAFEKLARAKQADEIAQDIAGSLLVADITLPSEDAMAVLEGRVVAAERALAAITKSEAADGTLATARDDADAAEAALSAAEDAYKTLVAELGACPLCGSTETWEKHDHE